MNGCVFFNCTQLCPTRYDMLHQHFRKICHLLADFDEWGQTVALNVLLRYGRTQFLSPFTDVSLLDGRMSCGCSDLSG